MLVGIDTIDVVRMEKFVQNETSLARYFTPDEAAYVTKTVNRTMRLAGIYCVKEAFLKALGIGMFNGVELNEIEVVHDKSGRPSLKLTENARMMMIAKGVTKADISITHTFDIAMAVCILY